MQWTEMVIIIITGACRKWIDDLMSTANMSSIMNNVYKYSSRKRGE